MSLVRTSSLCCSYSRTTNSASLYAPFGAAPFAPWHAAQHLTLSSSSRSSVALTAIGSTSNQAIEKLDKEYCNEFVCESSPAVEMSVRSFAKDLERLRYTPNLFSRDTKYSDPVRQFQGNNTYLRHTWILDSIQKPKTVVNRMQMLDKATAQIDWRLTGLLGGAPVDISFTSVIEMNLLTGRILSTRETWDLKGLQAPIAFMVTANRTAWSAKQASMDAQEGLGRVADSISSSLDSMDDDGKIYRDPTDPTKFFQQGQNQQYNDMLTFAMIVISLYAVFKGFSTVIKL